jgi:hypothetical protein
MLSMKVYGQFRVSYYDYAYAYGTPKCLSSNAIEAAAIP